MARSLHKELHGCFLSMVESYKDGIALLWRARYDSLHKAWDATLQENLDKAEAEAEISRAIARDALSGSLPTTTRTTASPQSSSSSTQAAMFDAEISAWREMAVRLKKELRASETVWQEHINCVGVEKSLGAGDLLGTGASLREQVERLQEDCVTLREALFTAKQHGLTAESAAARAKADLANLRPALERVLLTEAAARERRCEEERVTHDSELERLHAQLEAERLHAPAMARRQLYHAVKLQLDRAHIAKNSPSPAKRPGNTVAVQLDTESAEVGQGAPLQIILDGLGSGAF